MAKKKTTPKKKQTSKAVAKKQSPKKRSAKKQPPKKLPAIQQPTKIAVSKTKAPGLNKIISSQRFAKLYASLSVLILMGTSLYWSLLGARLQASNADQVVNAYFFDNTAAFHGALMPGQHSFLAKWPLFFLIKLFGYSPLTFISITVLTVLITVALLALILYRIERRLLIFGTLCLALASILLLIPTMPYAGGLLPANMAMLTTRNLEYLLYIAGLALLTYSPSIKSPKFWGGTGLLVLLIASDKLFLPLSIGGALIALTIYGASKGRHMVDVSATWLKAGFIAAAGAMTLLWLINTLHLTHITNQSASGPYSVSTNSQGLMLGSLYLVLGLLTNFGANPAFDATKIHDIYHQATSHLWSLGGIGYVINLVLLLGGVFAVWRLIRISFSYNKTKSIIFDRPAKLSIMLIWSTAVATGVFVATNHYYAVDARYLTIALFTVFISAATYLRSRNWQPKKLVIAGCIIAVGILAGLTTATSTYNAQKTALATINDRNTLIAQALAQHPKTTLMGDYWRVLPIKLNSKNKLNVNPLSGCTQEREILSSTAWQSNVNKPFVYLLSLDQNLTDYPNCSINDVINKYGRPDSSIAIAGSLSDPKELLLFYDNGSNKNSQQDAKGSSTVLPITLNELHDTSCEEPTTMNIVAHQDDDLLFMNPNVLHDIKNGNCVRTVYVTAGDAGTDKLYWLSRQRGSEAAYSQMIGVGQTGWVEKIVKLANNQYITVASPKGNPKISLIFMHLPDGNINGRGFKDTQFESLQKLENGYLQNIHSVDKNSTYNAQDLVEALGSLIKTYAPAKINTQANYVSKEFPDHSDHIATGRFANLAYSESAKIQDKISSPPINFYIGYPISAFAENLNQTDIEQKAKIFFMYSKYDDGVCNSMQRCLNAAYSRYLKRQYQYPLKQE